MGSVIAAMLRVTYLQKSIASNVSITERGVGIMREIFNGVKNQSSYERFEVSRVREDRYVVARLLVL